MTEENDHTASRDNGIIHPAHSNQSQSAGDEIPNEGLTEAPPVSVEDNRASDVDRLTLELVDAKDRYLRTVAEMDNMRKRLEREKSEFIKFSSESILKDMIPILDSLEKAIPAAEFADTVVGSYRDGVLMVQKQFLQMLAKHGLEPVEAVAKSFDPNFHQAIQRIESKDVSVETVSSEFAKGYTLNGRLLRPAMVSVKVPE